MLTQAKIRAIHSRVYTEEELRADRDHYQLLKRIGYYEVKDEYWFVLASANPFSCSRGLLSILVPPTHLRQSSKLDTAQPNTSSRLLER